jgi:KDO2-lipid IV(A) lauroyltransferase
MAKDRTQGWRVAFASSIARFAVIILWKVLSWLPLDNASDLGGALGRHLFIRVLKPRKIKKNLRMAFPNATEPKIKELTCGIFDNVGRVAAEITHLGSFREDDHGTTIILEGLQNVDVGKPAVFVGGHLSNWEIGVMAISRVTGKLNAIVTPLGVPVIDRRLAVFRSRSGVIHLPRSGSGLRTVFSRLAQGTSVAMLVDQRVNTGPMVSFLGRPTVASGLPATLALRFGVPIIPVDGERLTPSTFVVRFHSPILPEKHFDGDQLQDLTQRMMTVIEGFVRASPNTWFCHKARWKPQDSGADHSTPAATVSVTQGGAEGHCRPRRAGLSRRGEFGAVPKQNQK